MYPIKYFVLLLVTQISGAKNIIERKCSAVCSCQILPFSSKVEAATCVVPSQDNSLECSVEWPVLSLTVKKYQFESYFLQRCQRIEKLMINSESTLTVLRSDMFQFNGFLKTLIVKAPIQTLDSVLLKYLPSLTELQISETRIESITRSIFEECPISEMLKLGSNRISFVEDYSFKNCIYLIELDLSGNKLKKINFSTFEGVFNLERLNLGKNKIETIDDLSFRSLKKLKFLTLSGNSLISIKRKTFGYLESLTHLKLDSNKITDISVEAFKGLRSIQVINLKNNKMVNLDLILFLNLKQLKISFPDIDCVQSREEEHGLFSADVLKEFAKHPLCHDFQRPVTTKVNNPPEIVVIIQISPIILIPMVLRGLLVTLVSIIVLAVVCHVKNKRINELRLQELQLPMQSTL